MHYELGAYRLDLGLRLVPIWYHEGTPMPTLTIKGLPPALYRRLKAQAAAHRRSLNGEIIICLERSLAGGPIDPTKWLEEASVDVLEISGGNAAGIVAIDFTLSLLINGYTEKML